MLRYILPIIVIFSAFMPVMANAKMACALKDEKRALDTRAMQSQLMVAALSCDEHKHYNEFVKKFKNELVKSSEHLKGYFSRNYNRDADNQLNNFITLLANESSKQSLNINSEKFCSQAAELFDRIMDTKPSKVLDFASSREFASLHKVNVCN